jgi:hypothetical protein
LFCTHGVFFLFDFTNNDSFNHMVYRITTRRKIPPDLPWFVEGTKADLVGRVAVSAKEAREFAVNVVQLTESLNYSARDLSGHREAAVTFCGGAVATVWRLRKVTVDAMARLTFIPDARGKCLSGFTIAH